MKVYSPKQIIKMIEQDGWKFSHKCGSHFSYCKTGINEIITVPMGKKEVCLPLAKRLLKVAGIR